MVDLLHDGKQGRDHGGRAASFEDAKGESLGEVQDLAKIVRGPALASR
jgi:hypothetical protein